MTKLYHLLTESGFGYSPQLVERYGIHVIPMHVTMGFRNLR